MEDRKKQDRNLQDQYFGKCRTILQGSKMQDRKMQDWILNVSSAVVYEQVRRWSLQHAAVSVSCWTLRKARRGLPSGGQQLIRHRQ